MTLPRISVIMPSFNQAAYLEEAICSALDQNYPNLEFMILDGESTDGSPEIIERYASHLAYWYSRPDGGQSAAIDCGMSRATGALAGWLNSDDVLLPGALQSVAEAYLERPEGGLFGGNLMFINRDGIITGFLRMPANADWFARKGVFAVSGPGSFYCTRLYHDVGGIRHDFHYAMDNELYIRMILNGACYVYIDRYLAAFRRHAGQKTTAQREMAIAETRKLDAELRKRGLSYRSTKAVMLYYLWQTVNGNYSKKWLHARHARRRHWRSWSQFSSG
jgi:glycosyltransferase involved in cell wall biosynthesis